MPADHRDRAAPPSWILVGPLAAQADAAALQRDPERRLRQLPREHPAGIARRSSRPRRIRDPAAIDRTEWATQPGNPAAYAPYVTEPVIYQFARGDQTVPNPTTSAISARAGARTARRCTGTTSSWRRIRRSAGIRTPPDEPRRHGDRTDRPRGPAADGDVLHERRATTIDPDGPGPVFETPTSMVPEDLGFIP